jgi:hypothetical protein
VKTSVSQSATRRGRPAGAKNQESLAVNTAADKATTDKLAKSAKKLKKRVAAKAIKSQSCIQSYGKAVTNCAAAWMRRSIKIIS